MHCNNLAIIGMTSAGKSAVGKILARELNFKFIDIDKILEKQTGFTPKQFIEKFGEKKFLDAEEGVALALSDLSETVISTGGSVIYSEKAMEYLSKISIIIFLDTPLKLIKSRQPSLNRKGIIGLRNNNFDELYSERYILYKKYANKIFTPKEHNNVHEIALKIKEIIT